MKIFLSPSIALHSPAMVRISNALTRYLPSHFTITSQVEEADLCIFYPVGFDWAETHLSPCLERGQKYALIQCCFLTSAGTFDMWLPWWQKAAVVWSYLDLIHFDSDGPYGPIIKVDNSSRSNFNYYEAPLGVDECFTYPTLANPKRDYIVTTGSVHGYGAEAILECWEAANRCDLTIVHVGPCPVGIQLDTCGSMPVVTCRGVTDQTLRGIYQNARYTCSLRYKEGFELPALESLSCGTPAVVFTQPATTKWFFRYADFVQECEGEKLVGHLVRKFSDPSYPSTSQIEEVRRFFDWRIVVERFWRIIEEEMKK